MNRMTNEMTAKEAVKQIKENCYFASISERTKQALDKAIQALEQSGMTEQWQELKETITEMRDNGGTGTQQDVCKFLANLMETLEKQMQEPSEDCRNCKKWNKCPCGKEGHENGTSIGYSIGECKDYEPCEDAVSRQAVINTIFYKSDNSCDVVLSTDLMDRIKHLPSVTPQRKRGKWIFKAFDEETGISDSYWCSECNRPLASAYKDFCASCGSYNGGGEDEDSD